MIRLDCSSGMSGDMFAAALVAAGADGKKVVKALRPIAKTGFRKVRKRGVRAIRFDVGFEPASREYPDLVESIRRLRLKPASEKFALRVLRILADAESKAHGIPLSKVSLHEAVDSVVDSVAAAVALEDLEALDGPFSSSVVSAGFIAPATRRIIEEYGIPVRFSSDLELLTPTGAAILAALDCDYGTGCFGCEAYGAGSMDLPWPNVLGLGVAWPKSVLETNVDDCTPEQISHMMKALADDGALDVHVIPCMMKKGRIGFLVRVLTEKPEEHAAAIMAETGSIGVRVLSVESRFELPRRIERAKVRIKGSVERIRVKFTPIGYKPEFDDVSAAARKHGLTFGQVRESVSASLKGRR